MDALTPFKATIPAIVGGIGYFLLVRVLILILLPSLAGKHWLVKMFEAGLRLIGGLRLCCDRDW